MQTQTQTHTGIKEAAVDNLQKTPKYVLLEIMYRDCSNDKCITSYLFTNDLDLTKEQIEIWAEAEMQTDDVIAAKYGLPNIAKGTYEDDICGEDDHPYIEISDWDVTDYRKEGELHDEPFSTVYHAMIEDKGVDGWGNERIAQKINAAVESIDRATEILNGLPRTMNREEKDRVSNQLEVLMLKLVPDAEASVASN